MIETYKDIYVIALALFDNNSTLSLKQVVCIHHLIWFKKDQAKIQALIDFDSEINTMIPAYVDKLSLKIRPTNVEA